MAALMKRSFGIDVLGCRRGVGLRLDRSNGVVPLYLARVDEEPRLELDECSHVAVGGVDVEGDRLISERPPRIRSVVTRRRPRSSSSCDTASPSSKGSSSAAADLIIAPRTSWGVRGGVYSRAARTFGLSSTHVHNLSNGMMAAAALQGGGAHRTERGSGCAGARAKAAPRARPRRATLVASAPPPPIPALPPPPMPPAYAPPRAVAEVIRVMESARRG